MDGRIETTDVERVLNKARWFRYAFRSAPGYSTTDFFFYCKAIM